MDLKKKYCSSDFYFRSYYRHQAGGRLEDIRVFRGAPYQRGYGIGSVIKRYGIPFLKFLGEHLLSTGMSIGSDISAKPNIEEALSQRVKESSKRAVKEGLSELSKLVDQSGQGLYKARRSERIKRDIFS